MDGESDTDSNIDDDHQVLQQDTNDDDDDDDDDDAIAERANSRRLELISVLQRKDEYLTHTRNTIDDLVYNFLEFLERDVHEHLCNDYPRAEEYDGLDSRRDTEKEVEATVRLFPNILNRQSRTERRGGNFYPIQCLAYNFYWEADRSDWRCNWKAVSFIPLLVRLSIEFGYFNNEELNGELRGGILFEDEDRNKENVLRLLMYHENHEHHELVDDKFLLVIKELKQMGYLKKEDIQRHNLLKLLCCQFVFSEKRFRFLVEWDPTSVLHMTEYSGRLPLHLVLMYSTIQGFQLLFEYGIRYYPKKKGINLLFKKDYPNLITPFQEACKKCGREKVITAMEETLLQHCRSDDVAGPYNVVDALITAAIDENVHLDCVYFLLQRHPDVLQELLSSPSSVAATAGTTLVPTLTSIINQNHENENDDHN
jgi:hypothetical protein